MNNSQVKSVANNNETVSGDFVSVDGERFYAIQNVDNMATFFISLISNSDHWLFVASNGGLTAGRVSPETALFPYITVDKIYESTLHTGPRTLIRVVNKNNNQLWEPFNGEQYGRYHVQKNLYKNNLGNKILFEEINHDLQLSFRYSWETSEKYGFVRSCSLENHGGDKREIELLDGLQNILPAGTPRFTQTNSSYLVDAYKWNELEEGSGLAMYTLYSAITDRAEPCESLKSNSVFCIGLEHPTVLISSEQLERFKRGFSLHSESVKRGVRGSYWVSAAFDLNPGDKKSWQMIANVEQDQHSIVQLIKELEQPKVLCEQIANSIAEGGDSLARIMASADGFQLTRDENVAVHHYANVMFNVLRGGIFNNQYHVSGKDFAETIKGFNKPVFNRNKNIFSSISEDIPYPTLMALLGIQKDRQLVRLGLEYLPITFGRRHGDPSRPWNQFEIKLKDDNDQAILSYQGNWRDIFQNWEALLISYPEFIASVIAKFVNASTMDGYNPYRITKQGIDWEVEDPEDPWSYIGYWGDHQIIYLLKLLELSKQYHPDELIGLLDKQLFSYANVPYRIKSIDDLIEDPKNTVTYDDELAALIEQREVDLGADGKLVLDADNEVYQVNLLEKLLVPLLAKLGNLVVDGGIWLNTQRPEWNDANNALVGQGLSMVTLYYMRRYVAFLQDLLIGHTESIELSGDVCKWLCETAKALKLADGQLSSDEISDSLRSAIVIELGVAASNYRQRVYQQKSFGEKYLLEYSAVHELLESAQKIIDHSIESNRREDGLYHAYNLMAWQSKTTVSVENLYPMLEGQVAVLSSGAIAPKEAVHLLEALFSSELYREDQDTFILYPDRPFSSFLDKNSLPSAQVETIPLLKAMLSRNDFRLVKRDLKEDYRFNAGFVSAKQLNSCIEGLIDDYGISVEASKQAILDLYELVFNHQAFTGRSGGMFGFEGLGSIYWHMVAKLLLAVQEIFFQSRLHGDDDVVTQQLAALYYRVRAGIGFNKTPLQYGAFPTDPYSHTPKHIGAQQPGMTGQVKEEVIARFGELGVRVDSGKITFDVSLLKANEFINSKNTFTYLDVNADWQSLAVDKHCLAFTWCQIPVVYRLENRGEPAVNVLLSDGTIKKYNSLSLSEDISREIFLRSGLIKQITVLLTKDQLCV
jgi:hypothetical protein